MDVKGIVIAVSEVLRLESEHIILLKVYNKQAGVVYHILIQDLAQFYWKSEITFNCWYRFSNLKAHTWNEGTKQEIILLKTSSSSELFEIKEDLYEDESFADFEQTALTKCAPLFSPGQAMQTLISYEGYVTSIKDASLGLYELDKKLLLYTTFLTFVSEVPDLKKGFKILVCNAHLFNQKTKMMICCGISSVKILENHKSLQENINDSDGIQLIHKLALTFYDVMWLERCFQQLCKKFYPSIIPNKDNPFSWSSRALETILYTLVRCGKDINGEENGKQDRSLIHEFISNPHTCAIFPKMECFGPELPPISDILSNAKAQISWLSCNASWKCCAIINDNSALLVGLLHLAEDGNFYILDESESVLCVFTTYTVGKGFNFAKVTCHQDTVSEIWKEALIGSIIILKDFQIVFEEILDQNAVGREYIYICANISSIIPFYKNINIERPPDSICKHLTDLDVLGGKLSQYKTTNFSQCSGLSSSEYDIVNSNHFVKDEASCKKQLDCSDFIPKFKRQLSLESEVLEDEHMIRKKSSTRVSLCQQFFVIGKTLPITKNSVVYQQAMVLLQRKAFVEISQNCFGGLAQEFSNLMDLEDKYSTSFISDSPSFSGNSSSNLKFTSGISEVESKLVILNFEGSSVVNCAAFLPEHNYLMVTPKEVSTGFSFLNQHPEQSTKPRKKIVKDYEEIAIVAILPETVFLPLPVSSNKVTSTYENIPNILSLKKYSIEQLLANRSFMKYNIIRGMVADKWFDIISNGDNCSKGTQKKALCLVLKDCVAPCSIRVYIHDYPDFVCGLLPNTVLEMFGLSFCQSEKGNAYLKSCGLLGLQIIKTGGSSACGCESIKIPQTDLVPWNFFFKVNKNCLFKSLCFVLRILHIEMFPVCSSCPENVLKCCSCSSNIVIKTKARLLVDDGSYQVVVHCGETSIRYLFDFTDNEWNALITHISDSGEPLIYSYTMLMDQLVYRMKMSQSLTSRVFYNLCSSSVMRGPVVMDCRSYLVTDQPMMGGNSTSRKSMQQFRYFCVKLSEPTREVSLEFLNHMKKRLM